MTRRESRSSGQRVVPVAPGQSLFFGPLFALQHKDIHSQTFQARAFQLEYLKSILALSNVSELLTLGGMGNVAGIVGSIASVYSAISSIRSGRAQEEVIALLRQKNQILIRLDDHIIYSPRSLNVVVPSSQEFGEQKRTRELLLPVQRMLKTDIIASAMVATPEKLRHEFRANPWDCLMDVRPVGTAMPNLPSDFVPVAFEHNNQIYVGWQKRGMLNSLGLNFTSAPEAWLEWQREQQKLDRVLREPARVLQTESRAGAEAADRKSKGQAIPKPKIVIPDHPNLIEPAAPQPKATHRGTVKWFNPLRGFGFIRPSAGDKDVFVHISAVERAGLNTLNEGQTVEYELVTNRGKTSAENLKVS